MALGLKQLIRSNSSGAEIWITDETLAYAASVNVGGWGSPNPELNQSALVAYLYQTVPSEDGTTTTKVVLNPLTSAIAYSALNTNSTQQSIGFGYNTDGHYTCSLIMVPVSNDAITTLAGHTLVDGDYFMYNGVVYQETGVGHPNIVITDYSILVAASALIKLTSEVIFFVKLSLKKELEYYRQYRDARNANDPDLANELRKKMDDLEADLSGANWEFAAGLYTQAENIVQELLEQHEIPTP